MKKVTPKSKPVVEFKDPVQVIRTCDKDMKGFGGFPWPESGPVEAPEEWDKSWGPKPSNYIGGFRKDVDCGGGLHGIAGVTDDWGLLNWDIEAKALILKTEKAELLQVSGKVKFRFCVVEKVTSLAAALCEVICTAFRINQQVEEIKKESGHDKIASGADSQLAASGVRSKLAASGVRSQLAASGKDSVAVAASPCCTAKAGENGAIVLTWHDGNRYRIAVAYVGENGIEAGVFYKLNESGAFIAA